MNKAHAKETAKVLVLGPSTQAVSGVSTHLLQLFSSKLSDNYKLIHFQVGSEGRNESQLTKLFRMVIDPFRFAHILHKESIDLVHINASMDTKSFWRDTAFVVASKILRRKTLFQLHGGDLPIDFCNNKYILLKLLLKSLSWNDAIVLLTKEELTQYQKLLPDKSIHLVPNAVDIQAFTTKDWSSIEHKKIVFCYIGRIEEAKGIFDTLEALKILTNKGIHEFSFKVAGDGAAKNKMIERIKSLQLEEQVNYVGSVFNKEKTTFWQSSDVLIFPSYAEGMPYTILESLASGTPMITTNVGAIGDVIINGVHGVYTEVKNPLLLSNKIEDFLTAPATLEGLSRNCRRLAREEYSKEALAKNFQLIYDTLCNKQSNQDHF